MEIGVLGSLRVTVDDDEVPLRAGRSKLLLISLALAGGDVVPAEELFERLWEDREPPQHPQNTLHTLVANLRRTLASHGGAQITTVGRGYALQRGAFEVDARTFERLLNDARRQRDIRTSSSTHDALAHVESALALWRGDPFADVGAPTFLQAESVRLRELRDHAIELRAELLLELGRHEGATESLRALVARQPLRERAHELLMLALYRAGRQADALEAFRTARALLVDQLGIDPGSDLRRMEQLILAQSPELEGPLHGERPTADSGAATRQDPSTVPRALDDGLLGDARISAPPTSLVGRDQEMQRLSSLLRQRRQVTLTGPGGAGKTRLAIELANAASGHVVFVDLSSTLRDHEVALTVASVLGVPVPAGVDALDSLAAAARPVDVLVVLDTCEQVLEGAAATATVLLRSWPGARVLATSRRPLRVSGELIWPVAPLALPVDSNSAASIRAAPAVRLFVERAQSVNPDFALSDDNAQDVVALCSALDGLPLALELAAAHVDVLSPRSLLARLDRRFAILTDGPLDMAPRQRDLRATIDWSVQLVDEVERRFFAQLSLFAGPFTLDAASRVAGTDVPRTTEVLTGLVRHSLVRRLDDELYDLLDSLRAFASELATRGEDLEGAQARFIDYYAELAVQGDAGVKSTEQLIWWRRLRAEQPNIRAALEAAFATGRGDVGAQIVIGLGWFWTHDGQFHETDRWVSAALEVSGLDEGTRSHLLLLRSFTLSPLGRLAETLETASQAYELAAVVNDERRAAQALTMIGATQWALADFATSLVSLRRAREVAQRAADPWSAALATTMLARALVDSGDPEVDESVIEALSEIRRTGDRHMLAVALLVRARYADAHGEHDVAADAAAEALHAAREVRYQEGMLAAVHILGVLAAGRGDLVAALAAARENFELALRMDHAAGICEAIELLALVRAQEGRASDALVALAAADRIREDNSIPLIGPDRHRIQEVRVKLESGDAAAMRRARTSAAGLLPEDFSKLFDA